VVMARAHSR